MIDQLPVRFWLLLGIGAAAFLPARYVFRHLAHSRSQRDLLVMRPVEAPDWRSRRQFGLSLAVLAALAALAVFIFTPAAERFARSPSLVPILLGAVGAWSLLTVPMGLASGRIEPFIRSARRYERETQPKRFWASLAWNAVLGCMCLWFAFHRYGGGPAGPLEAQCYNAGDALAPQEALSACSRLLDGQGGAAPRDRGRWLAARGRAYHRMRDYQHALADYSEAIRLDPNDFGAHFNRGLIEEMQGDRKRAIADYGEAIRIRTDDADMYLRRGEAWLGIGKFDAAVADLTRVHELRPGDAVALADRGISYAWKQDAVRAEADFAAVRATDPENLVMLRGEALLAMNAGDLDGAARRLSAVLRRDPEDGWSLMMRASVYRGIGEDAKSQADTEALERLRKAHPAE